MISRPLRRRTQAERREETRARLVAAATSILEGEGYGQASTAAIAARAGVSTGALHHHFPSKDDLMFAVLDAMNARIIARVERIRATFGVAPGSVAETVDQLWAIYGDRDYWAVWEVIIGTRNDPRAHARVIQHRHRTMRDIFEIWAGSLEVDTRTLARLDDIFLFMLAAMRGLVLERFVARDKAFYDTQLAMLARSVAAEMRAALEGRAASRVSQPTAP